MTYCTICGTYAGGGVCETPASALEKHCSWLGEENRRALLEKLQAQQQPADAEVLDVLALDATTEILAFMFPDLPFHSTQLAAKIQAIISEAIEKGTEPWRTPFCVKCGPELRLEWRDGAPGNPWDKEWFIAETTYGDRVVLTALPKEWTYDFKTADETYIKADKIKRWMQFPDSQFIAPDAMPQPATEK